VDGAYHGPVKIWRWSLLLLGAAVAGAAACSNDVVVMVGHGTTTTHTPTGTGTPSGTTTNTGTGSWTSTTGTGTGSWTTTTTPTTTTSGCYADLTAAVGATAECTTCMSENCCVEAQSYIANPGTDTMQVMVDCGIGAGDGPCMTPCTVQVCSGSVMYMFFQQCGECVNASCCAPWTACENDPSCLNDCLLSDPGAPACCVPGAPFQLLDQCEATHCAGPCSTPWWPVPACG
jgi:hypothetical protein